MEGWLVLKMLEENVVCFFKKIYIIFEDCYFFYEYVDVMVNRVVNLVMIWGFFFYIFVVMMMENELVFLWMFFGEIFIK